VRVARRHVQNVARRKLPLGVGHEPALQDAHVDILYDLFLVRWYWLRGDRPLSGPLCI
jgi:hypothetical protein